MPNRNQIFLLGYASSIGGPDPTAGEGPLVLQKSSYLQALEKHLDLQWHTMIVPDTSKPKSMAILENNIQLASSVESLVKQDKFFAVLGGDHTCAIGTWSGAASAIDHRGPIGLIWIDAHMDSHTPETTLTGNLHGMPLACLLGYGNPDFTHILSDKAKIKPEHLCLIGIRSFEPAEEAFLKSLKVKVYNMEDIKTRGLETIMREALAMVTQGTAGFGVSLDIDSIDPIDAPATDVSEPGGIRANDLLRVLNIPASNPALIGIEITEFDPHRDIDQKTEKLVPELLSALVKK